MRQKVMLLNFSVSARQGLLKYMLWFNFIIDSNFVCFVPIVINNHTQYVLTNETFKIYLYFFLRSHGNIFSSSSHIRTRIWSVIHKKVF